MDGVGKVDAGSTGGQIDDIALGGKGEHLFRQKVALEIVEQVAGILAQALVLQQLADPCQTVVQLIVAFAALLVLPVGGNAVLGLLVHFAGADLHLKGDALVPDDGSVQALIAVGLGGGDIIFKAVGQRVVHIVDETKGAVTLGQRIQNDSYRVDIVDLVKGLVLHDGLAVDAVDALDPALDGGTLDAAFHQTALDDAGHLDQKLLAGALAEHSADFGVAHRVQIMQAAILQLLLDVQDAKAVGDGGVHLHGFASLIAALLLRPSVAGAHIVQPVAQLDDHHTHVPAHSQQHLAQVLGLQFFNIGELDLGQLGHAVHQQRHFLAKGGFQVVQRGGGILHYVMQQGGGDALGVHAQIQHQPGDCQRVADIGLAAAAAHAVMGVIGQLVGLLDHLHIVGLAAGLNGLAQLFPRYDLRAHLRGQCPLRCVCQQCRSSYGGGLLHRLVQMGLGRVAVLVPYRSRDRGSIFLSLRHL